MRQLFPFFLLLISLHNVYGQSKNNISEIKCDTTLWAVVNSPPKLNIPITELEALLNREIDFKSLKNDSVYKIFINVIIDCYGMSKYETVELPESIIDRVGDLQLRKMIVDVLQRNCHWSPGKRVFNKRNFNYATCIIWLEFEIINNKIKILSKINTT